MSGSTFGRVERFVIDVGVATMAQHAWLCGDTWCHTSYTSSFPSTQGPTVLPTIPDTVHAVHDTVHDTVHAVFWTVHGRSMPHHWEEGRYPTTHKEWKQSSKKETRGSRKELRRAKEIQARESSELHLDQAETDTLRATWRGGGQWQRRALGKEGDVTPQLGIEPHQTCFIIFTRPSAPHDTSPALSISATSVTACTDSACAPRGFKNVLRS